MREEVLRILKMVEEGKITAAEAERLLSALEKERSEPPRAEERRPKAAAQELELDPSLPLKVRVRGGNLTVIRSEEARIEGKGLVLDAGGEITLTGKATLYWPGKSVLGLRVSWGNIEGEVPRLDLRLNMANAEIEGVVAGRVSVRMGNAELRLAESFEGLEGECEMGNLEIYTPVKVSVDASEKWGAVSVDPEAQDPQGPPIRIFSRAGSVEVVKA